MVGGEGGKVAKVAVVVGLVPDDELPPPLHAVTTSMSPRTSFFMTASPSSFPGILRRPKGEGDMGDCVYLPSPAAWVTVVTASHTARKTRRWRMRALLGERVRWYELPEEVRH